MGTGGEVKRPGSQTWWVLQPPPRWWPDDDEAKNCFYSENSPKKFLFLEHQFWKLKLLQWSWFPNLLKIQVISSDIFIIKIPLRFSSSSLLLALSDRLLWGEYLNLLYWNLMILVLSYDTRETSVLFQKWLKQGVSDFPTFHAFCMTWKEINYKTLLCFSRSAPST